MKRSAYLPNGKNHTKRFKNSEENDNLAQTSNYTFAHLSNSHQNNEESNHNQDPYIRVSKSIWNYFTKNMQSIECYQKKMELAEALRHMFQDIFPYLGVYIVGSSANGFGTNHSDMDICLMVSHEEINQKNEALLLLRAIAKAMRRVSFIKSLNVIAAKCPIIKFHDSHNNIDCDINLNNHVGIRNTHLLKSYSDIDWRVKPLILIIKYWADFHEINDASQKTISSYSYALMAIYYMQAVCKPPVLPVLQKLNPEKYNIKTDIRTLRLNDNENSWTSTNTQSLGELFVGFLEFYTSFNFSEYVISVRTGELIPTDCLSLDDESAKSSHIKIEEPFDLTNTARSVYDMYTFTEIKHIFRKSAQVLKSQKNFDSIVTEKFGDLGAYDNW